MSRFTIFLVMALLLVSMSGFALADGGGNQSGVDDEPEVGCDELECEEGEKIYRTGEYNDNGCEITKCIPVNKTQNQVKVIKAEQTRAKLQERNRLRINQSELPEGCTVTGSVLKCNINGQRTMAVFAGKSGNTILQVKGVNASTKVQLYKQNQSFYGDLGDNETVLINYFPDQVREMIQNRVHADTEYEGEIELDEEGMYRVKTKKKARLFYLVPVREKVRAQVNPETGEIIKIRNPWWGFLAKDVVDDDEEPEENNESA